MRRRWDTPDEELPKRPYRDSAVLHGVLAAAIVLVSFLTGGSLTRALVVAVAFFVIATGWSWTRWRRRLQELDKAPRRGPV